MQHYHCSLRIADIDIPDGGRVARGRTAKGDAVSINVVCTGKYLPRWLRKARVLVSGCFGELLTGHMESLRRATIILSPSKYCEQTTAKPRGAGAGAELRAPAALTLDLCAV